MPKGGKDAFLSKVTFRRESDWYSKTKQMLKDMETIEERATRIMNTLPCEEPKGLVYEAYKLGATEQKAIDDAKYKELRALAYDMYRKAQYLTTDASGLRKAMDAFHKFICYDEPKTEE